MIWSRLHNAGALFLICGIPFLAACGARADGLQAGLYRIEQQPVVNGVASPVQQSERCLTAEAVADLDKTFSPVSRTTNSACERTEHELTEQKLKWRLQCTGQLNMDVAGEFLFETPQRYTATIVTEASMA